MSGNPQRKMQQQQEQQLFSTLASFQRDQAAAENAATQQANADRARISAQVAAEEQAAQDAAKKKSSQPLVRSSIVTSPFGLLSNPNVASRTFLGG